METSPHKKKQTFLAKVKQRECINDNKELEGQLRSVYSKIKNIAESKVQSPPSSKKRKSVLQSRSNTKKQVVRTVDVSPGIKEKIENHFQKGTKKDLASGVSNTKQLKRSLKSKLLDFPFRDAGFYKKLNKYYSSGPITKNHEIEMSEGKHKQKSNAPSRKKNSYFTKSRRNSSPIRDKILKIRSSSSQSIK